MNFTLYVVCRQRQHILIPLDPQWLRVTSCDRLTESRGTRMGPLVNSVDSKHRLRRLLSRLSRHQKETPEQPNEDTERSVFPARNAFSRCPQAVLLEVLSQVVRWWLRPPHLTAHRAVASDDMVDDLTIESLGGVE